MLILIKKNKNNLNENKPSKTKHTQTKWHKAPFQSPRTLRHRVGELRVLVAAGGATRSAETTWRIWVLVGGILTEGRRRGPGPRHRLHSGHRVARYARTHTQQLQLGRRRNLRRLHDWLGVWHQWRERGELRVRRQLARRRRAHRRSGRRTLQAHGTWRSLERARRRTLDERH